MRELKFRAWDKLSKQMIRPEILGMNGNFIEPSGKGIFTLGQFKLTSDGAFRDSSTGEDLHMTSLEGYILKPWQEPNKELELMQYTGLKDKNGVEVYEGDIVTARWFEEEADDDFEATGVMVWDGLGFDLKGVRFLHAFDSDQLEVIGNIYENKRLLK